MCYTLVYYNDLYVHCSVPAGSSVLFVLLGNPLFIGGVKAVFAALIIPTAADQLSRLRYGLVDGTQASSTCVIANYMTQSTTMLLFNTGLCVYRG